MKLTRPYHSTSYRHPAKSTNSRPQRMQLSDYPTRLLVSSTEDGCLSSLNQLSRSTILTISGKDGRNGILVWSTLASKPTPSQRLIPPGRVVVLALSPSGTYLATGSADGLVILWELSTGTLLASFDAHYKAVTCLAFSDDEAALVTASEDSMCSVWSIPTLVDEAFDSNLSHTPYSIFSDHTLPISDLFISRGCFPDLRIFTASLDKTIKIWSPLYPSAPLLSTFAVPGPAHHLTVDPLERFIIVSYATMLQNESSHQPADASAPAQSRSSSRRYLASPWAQWLDSTDRIRRGRGHVHQSAIDSDHCASSPLADRIESVVLCGLSNGKIVHLSIPSLQPLGQTVPHPNTTGEARDPVVYLNTFARPPDLIPSSVADALTGSDPSGSSFISPRPVGVLGRVVGRNGEPQRGPVHTGHPQRACRELCTMLKIEQVDGPSIDEDDPFSLPSREEPRSDTSSASFSALPDHSHLAAVDDFTLNSHSDSIEKLTAETVHLKAQLKQALAFNDNLWAGIVDGTLTFKEPTLPTPSSS
ncbi:hypothetical protein H4Q26_011238 [Puccinia striiformis f. sp. tritici PST-130]|nr:hypothetical protein H4Q26_011238 [Puccinia striiformis f. sp. tritici PST-130]